MINKNNHAYLISEIKFSDTNDLIKDICKNFFSKLDDRDFFCKKIDNNNYYDYVEFNLYLDEIKVDDIRRMKNNFYSISLESAGYKFYVIRNIELLSDKIANSLLKFIEEPPTNTIGIFTTRNINKVLPTIKSRCEEIRSSQNIANVEKYLLKNNNRSLDEFYLNSFYSIDEILIFDNCKNKNIIIHLFQNLKNDIDNEFNTLRNLEEFKKLSYKEINILINSLMIGMQSENKIKILELSNNLKYNLSKVLIFNKILNLI